MDVRRRYTGVFVLEKIVFITQKELSVLYLKALSAAALVDIGLKSEAENILDSCSGYDVFKIILTLFIFTRFNFLLIFILVTLIFFSFFKILW